MNNKMPSPRWIAFVNRLPVWCIYMLPVIAAILRMWARFATNFVVPIAAWIALPFVLIGKFFVFPAVLWIDRNVWRFQLSLHWGMPIV